MIMLQFIEIGCKKYAMYYIVNYISAASLFLWIFLHVKQYLEISPTAKRKKHPKLAAFLQLFIICIPFGVLFFFLNSYFGKWFTQGNRNYYGTLTAWLISFSIIPLFFRVSPRLNMDLFSEALPIQLFIAKLACFFQGCCYGFEMPGSWYYNQGNDRAEFPIQLVEALVAVALYFIMRLYKRRSKTPGSVFPVYLILYSISRIITEFFRDDSRHAFGLFDAYQVMSFVFLLIGGGLFYFVWIYKYALEKRKKTS